MHRQIIERLQLDSNPPVHLRVPELERPRYDRILLEALQERPHATQMRGPVAVVGHSAQASWLAALVLSNMQHHLAGLAFSHEADHGTLDLRERRRSLDFISEANGGGCTTVTGL